jgi:hypothetical protein
LTQCAILADEAWPLPPGIGVGVRMNDMIVNWIESIADSSTYAEVVEDEQAVFGMLFGKVKGQPAVIIAHTIKGKGVSFMENIAGWHGKSPRL